MTITVRLSGTPAGLRNAWGLAGTKAELMTHLKKINKDVELVTSGRSDYIVIPDGETTPSDSALKSKGDVMQLSKFVAMIKRKSGGNASSSRKGSRKTTAASKKGSSKKGSRKTSGKKTASRKKSTGKASEKASVKPSSKSKKEIAVKLIGTEWGRNGASLAETRTALRALAKESEKELRFVTSGDIDYVVVPKVGDHVPSALVESGVEILSLRQFRALL